MSMTLQQHPINQFKTEQMCNQNHWHDCGGKANYRNALYMQYTPCNGQCPT